MSKYSKSSGSDQRPVRAAMLGGLWLASAVAMSAVPAPTARADGFAGLWRGSGYVNPAEGRRERVRCRVVYTPSGRERYAVTARCATQSTNIEQVGEIRRSGRDSYIGNFYNADYNVRGSIRIRVQGGRQAVSLSSQAGTGELTLFKR